VANYYFNVHTVKAFEVRGDGVALNIGDIDGQGTTLMSVLYTALNSIAHITDDDAKVRLTVDAVWQDQLDNVDGLNAWVSSGRFGTPFDIRDQGGGVVWNGTKEQDMARPTLLRFEPDKAHDRVLYASGRYGQHGVFSRFTSDLLSTMRDQTGGEFSFRVAPATSTEVLLALLEGGNATEIEVRLPRADVDPADALAHQSDPDRPVTIELSHRLRLQGGRLDQHKVSKALKTAAGRGELARLVMDEAGGDDLSSGELRIPVKMKGGKTKVVVLPIGDDRIAGRLGFDVTGEPQTDEAGHPEKDWMCREAHEILTDLRKG
jgi:hypothetical protein